MNRKDFSTKDIFRFEMKFYPSLKELCWIWLGAKHRQGYGHFRLGDKIELSHRVAYCLQHGSCDPTMDVLHSCDNTSCVNPSHLFLGTHTDNMQDMHSKQRHPNLKLSETIVQEIRQLYQSGHYTQRQLAVKFEISNQHVSDLVTRKFRRFPCKDSN